MLRRLAAGALLLGCVALLGWQAYVPLAGQRELGAVGQRLPDLPQVHAATLRREAGFPVKVWLHRVDSIERAAKMAREYRGMEIDVVFDSSANYFDVGHPPTPSAGISLDRLLAAVPDVSQHYFWIDFKNLTESNSAAACALLLAIARKYGIVANTIVESVNPEALSRFTASGFYTSYYLFPESDPDTMSADQVKAYYGEVKRRLASSAVNALSLSHHHLLFAAKYFPDADILTWYRERDRNLRYYAVLAYLERQSRVKVILVRQLSRGYR
jgi:heptose-I-phosphate ethanolaminephosphotransferase